MFSPLPRQHDLCPVCNRPSLGDQIHDWCRVQTARPFPYADELRYLRTLYRELVVLNRTVGAVGKALREAQREWPFGVERLAYLRGLLDDLSNRLQQVGIARRRRRQTRT